MHPGSFFKVTPNWMTTRLYNLYLFVRDGSGLPPPFLHGTRFGLREIIHEGIKGLDLFGGSFIMGSIFKKIYKSYGLDTCLQ
jgi:hypothetical protein